MGTPGPALCALAALLSALPLHAHASATAEMDIQPRVLRVGEPASLKITVRGVDQPPAPPVEPINGLEIKGPVVGSSFSSSYINGRMVTDQSTIFTYQVIPLMEGQFNIGPYTYEAGGRQINLRAIEIKALSSRAASLRGDARNDHQPQPLIARLRASKHDLYTQEVFDLHIEILHRGDLNVGRDISLMNMPSAGLRLTPFQELAATREVVDNEVYQVRRFRCKAHALSAGRHTIAPSMRVPIILPRQRGRRRSFFDDPFGDMFGGRTEQITITPDPLELHVRPLPSEERPPFFTGAVGDFAYNIEPRPTTLEVGEPITIRMTIAGLGNIDQVSPPPFPDDDPRFRVYEIRRVKSEINHDTATGTRIFEQVVIPRSEEITELPPLDFAYFDPERGRYINLRQGPVPLTLHPSTREAARLVQSRPHGTELEPELLGEDLVHLKPPPPRWRPQTATTPLAPSPAFWLLQTLPALALASCWVMVRRRRDLEANPAKARRLRAPRRAREGIEQARQALRTHDTRSYHDGLWNALTAYFGDRLNLAPGAVEPATVLEACRRGGLPEEPLADLSRLFRQCEDNRYAGTDATADEPARLEADLKRLATLLKSAERIKL